MRFSPCTAGAAYYSREITVVSVVDGYETGASAADLQLMFDSNVHGGVHPDGRFQDGG